MHLGTSKRGFAAEYSDACLFRSYKTVVILFLHYRGILDALIMQCNLLAIKKRQCDRLQRL